MKRKKRVKEGRGRPRECPIHYMEIGDWIEVDPYRIESWKVAAYKLNASGEKEFRFFPSGGKRYVERRA
jgi:saccharopine dehydrogenase-like NADP-dependent oxidoreductase